MWLTDKLRRRRQMRLLCERMLQETGDLERSAISRSFRDTNNYFACAFFRSEVKRAIKHKDYDSLLVFSRYIDQSFSYEGVYNAVVALRGEAGHHVAGIVTDAHVIAADRLLSALRTHRDHELFKPCSDYRSILRCLYERPEITDLVIAIVTERDITDVEEIMSMIDLAPNTPQALTNGML